MQEYRPIKNVSQFVLLAPNVYFTDRKVVNMAIFGLKRVCQRGIWDYEREIIVSDAPYWNKRSLKISSHLVVICVFYRPEGEQFLPFLWYKITKSRIFSQCNAIET